MVRSKVLPIISIGFDHLNGGVQVQLDGSTTCSVEVLQLCLLLFPCFVL